MVKQPARVPAVRRRKSGTPARRAVAPTSFWDEMAAIGRKVPKKELAKLPRDFAQNFDEYLERGILPN